MHVCQRKVGILDHTASYHVVAVDQEKVIVIRDALVSSDQTSSRSVSGLAIHYQRFIKKFAKIFGVVYSVKLRTVKFNWNDRMQEALDDLKLKLTSAPVLVVPNFEKKFIVETDASSVAVSAVFC